MEDTINYPSDVPFSITDAVFAIRCGRAAEDRVQRTVWNTYELEASWMDAAETVYAANDWDFNGNERRALRTVFRSRPVRPNAQRGNAQREKERDLMTVVTHSLLPVVERTIALNRSR